MPYKIRDVDRAIYKRIQDQQFTVFQDQKEVRVRSLMSTPDAIIAKKSYPVINVEPGYNVNADPGYWKKDKVTCVKDGDFINKTTLKLVDLFYDYKIGFYVEYKGHCAFLEQEFLFLFSKKFLLPVVTADKTYKVSCTAGNLVNMDEFEDDIKVYRRDVIVTAHLVLEKQEVEKILRPYNGLDLTTNSL